MNNTMGIIITGFNDALGDLTKVRSVAALPFSGRYRLVDYILSNMVNSDITNIGITTTSKYRSLMDHLGSGKEWDLNRKLDGLHILPPYLEPGTSVIGEIDILYGIRDYLARSKQEYVLLAGADAIFNTDFYALRDFHIASGADITIMATTTPANRTSSQAFSVSCDASQRVTSIELGSDSSIFGMTGTGVFYLKKDLLCSLISRAISHGKHSFLRDILLDAPGSLRLYCYPFDGYTAFIDNIASYFHESMNLLDSEIYHQIYKSSTPILTKVKDQVPTIYGPNAIVRNSIIADGCVINGTVENSIIFRGVVVSESASVINSIVMQKSKINNHVSLNCAILDKNVVVNDSKTLIGQPNYPLVISKNSIV